MKAADFSLDTVDKEFIADALKDAKGWKECFHGIDRPLSEIFALAEMRLMEIKARGYGTIIDDE